MKTTLKTLSMLALVLISWASSIKTTNAHSVQVLYCATCESKLRLYIEHWHGTEDPATTSMTIDVTVNGVTKTYIGSPSDTIHNRPKSQLPRCATPLTLLARCNQYADTYNDWVIYDFDSIPCNVDIVVTVRQGHTVFTTDACGYMPAASDTFQIPCGAIGHANFIPPSGLLCASDSHVFINTSTPPHLNTFVWDFGHPSGYDSSFTKHPNWKFPGGGTYNVTLSVGDSLGCFDDTTIAVTIEDSPIPNWDWTMGCAPDYATMFYDSSWIASGSISRYLWDFGIPGTQHDTADVPNSQWTYPHGGQYDVTLHLWSQNGCHDSLQKTIEIGNQPWAAATWDTLCWDRGVPFHDLSTIIPEGQLGAWHWDFGDGNTSTDRSPTHKYEYAGKYNVKMLVTSATGCQDSVTMLVETNYEPPMVEPNVFTPNGDGKNDNYVIPEIDLHSEYLKYRGNDEEDRNMEIWVYNRWGREVLHSKKYDNSWNGKNKNGKRLDDGTYYYIVKYNTFCYPEEGLDKEESTVKIHKGTVTLIDGK